jgi:hypothetical protein
VGSKRLCFIVEKRSFNRKLNARKHPVRSRADWTEFGVVFAYALVSDHKKINCLARSELGKKDIAMHGTDAVCTKLGKLEDRKEKRKPA